MNYWLGDYVDSFPNIIDEGNGDEAYSWLNCEEWLKERGLWRGFQGVSHSHSSMFCLLLCIAGVTKRYQHFMDSDQFLKVAFCGSKQIQTAHLAHLNPFKPYWAMRIQKTVAKAQKNFLEIGDARCFCDQLVTAAPPWHCHTEISVQRWRVDISVPDEPRMSEMCSDVFRSVKIPLSDCPSPSPSQSDSLRLWDPEKVVKQKSMLDMRLCLWRLDSTWRTHMGTVGDGTSMGQKRVSKELPNLSTLWGW